MSEYEVGATDVIQCILDGIQYNIWAMKDAGYTTKMMAAGGKLVADDSCRTTIYKWMESGVQVVKEFVYALPFNWHFGITMLWMITTIFAIHCQVRRILG
jgi:hypothetical protein